MDFLTNSCTLQQSIVLYLMCPLLVDIRFPSNKERGLCLWNALDQQARRPSGWGWAAPLHTPQATRFCSCSLPLPATHESPLTGALLALSPLGKPRGINRRPASRVHPLTEGVHLPSPAKKNKQEAPLTTTVCICNHVAHIQLPKQLE